MDRGAWWATAHGVTKSWTRLSDEYNNADRKGKNQVKAAGRDCGLLEKEERKAVHSFTFCL